MKVEEARRILAAADETDEPVDLPLSILPKLKIDVVPDGGPSRWNTKGWRVCTWIGVEEYSGRGRLCMPRPTTPLRESTGTRLLALNSIWICCARRRNASSAQRRCRADAL